MLVCLWYRHKKEIINRKVFKHYSITFNNIWGGSKTETGNSENGNNIWGGPETNWQFWGALKTETHNSETGNNILGGLKTETGNFGEV